MLDTLFATTGRLFRSQQVRLILLVTALFSTGALAVVALMYFAVTDLMVDRVTNAIESDVQILSARFAAEGLPGLEKAVAERIRDDSEIDDYYLVADAAFGKIIGNMPNWPVDLPHAPGSASTHRLRYVHTMLSDGLHLVVARDLATRDAIRLVVIQTAIGAITFVVPLTLGFAFVLRRLILRWVRTLEGAAGRFVEGQLSYRLIGSGTGDVFDQLGDTVNRMFDRIEEMLRGVRHTTDEIAHDLRTPLARIRMRLEDLLRQEPRRRDEIEAIIAALDRTISLFNAHLRVAEIEAGARRGAFRVTALDELAQDVIDLYAASIEEKEQTISVSALPVRVMGDADLLFQAVANLVDNAVKYGPVGGHLTIAVDRQDDSAIITVTDQGPGIPASDYRKVTERFRRLSNAGTPGSGLGLCLVKAVAGEHAGTIRFADNHPGLRVTLQVRGLLAPAPSVPAEPAPPQSAAAD